MIDKWDNDYSVRHIFLKLWDQLTMKITNNQSNIYHKFIVCIVKVWYFTML